jgi:hypothetical protein
MSDEINHEEARRIAALQQPKHVLAQPYLDLSNKLESAYRALREIGQIAAEPGLLNAMGALEEAQRVAAEALPEEKKVLPFKSLKDVQG